MISKIIGHSHFTSDQELQRAAHTLNLDILILSRNEFLKHNFKPGELIIANTNNHGDKIGHWVSVYVVSKNKKYMFDSDGYDYYSLFKQNLNKLGKETTKRYQRMEQELCGHLALAWLLMTKTKPKKEWMNL